MARALESVNISGTLGIGDHSSVGVPSTKG